MTNAITTTGPATTKPVPASQPVRITPEQLHAARRAIVETLYDDPIDMARAALKAAGFEVPE